NHKGHCSVPLVLFPALLPVLFVPFFGLAFLTSPRADAARLLALLALGGKRLLRLGARPSLIDRQAGGALTALGVVRPMRPLACLHRRAEPQPPPVLQQERIYLAVLRLRAEYGAACLVPALALAFVEHGPEWVVKI